MTDWARHFIGWTEYLRRRGARGPLVVCGHDMVICIGLPVYPLPSRNDNARSDRLGN